MHVFRVAGVTFEGRQDFLAVLFRKDDLHFFLEREPNNPYDSNAIKVMVEIDGENFRVGYMPKRDNVRYIDTELPVIKSYRILDFGPRYSKGIELYCYDRTVSIC